MRSHSQQFITFLSHILFNSTKSFQPIWSFTSLLQILCCRDNSIFQPRGQRIQPVWGWEHRSHPALALHGLSELCVHVRKSRRTGGNITQHFFKVAFTDTMSSAKILLPSLKTCFVAARQFPVTPGHVRERQIISVEQRGAPAGVNFHFHPSTDFLHLLLHVQLLRSHLKVSNVEIKVDSIKPKALFVIKKKKHTKNKSPPLHGKLHC